MKKNKLKAWLALSMIAALCSCSTNEVSDETSSGEWQISVSRSGEGENATFDNDISVIGKKADGSVYFSGVYKKDNTGWVEDKAAAWSNDQEILNLYAISPTVTTIPTTIEHGGEAYLMDYLHQKQKSDNPSFTLNHVMAQLQIHIKVSGNENTQPSSLEVKLYKSATLKFNQEAPHVSSEVSGNKQPVYPTVNSKKDAFGSWVTETINVVPQTIDAENQLLSFWIGSYNQYTFTPTDAIEIKAGKITHIYLGVAYDEVTVNLNQVTVSDWGTSTSLEGGEATDPEE